jgi:heme/copper-type cytochrome/quinol oxidase subunit 2
MEQMSTFEMILLGILVLGVLLWTGPGVKAMLQKSREAENPDWAGALLPIVLVVLFVIFLIMMV